MARKTRARRTARGTSSVIEKSLRDAQKVLSSYVESGGRHVKDTIGSLVKIFENRNLTDALASGSRRISRAVAGTARRRSGASRRRRGSARTRGAKAASATRPVAKSGNRSRTRSRSAAARAASARRTRRRK